MAEPLFRTYSLVPWGGPGLACDEDGLALGPVVIAARAREGADGRSYRRRPRDEVVAALRLAYGSLREGTVERYLRGLSRVTDLLETEADALARIHAVLLGFPEIEPARMAKLSTASFRKSDDAWEDEPRVPSGSPDGGRWTSGGSGGGSVPSSLAAPAADLAGEAAIPGSLFGDIGAATLAGLESLGASFGAATAFLGVIFIPTNAGHASVGVLPGQSDIGYRYDEDTGQLVLSSNGETLFDGHRGPDGLFHDAGGNTFGRVVDGSLVLDQDAIPGYASRPSAANEPGAAAQSGAATDALRDSPNLCPDPTKDRAGGKSPRSIEYQMQISQLPEGIAVELNGVMFDGCRNSNGNMLEAKGEGFAWAMYGSDEWRENYEGVQKIMNQAQRQSKAALAAGRLVEWHFAEQPVADYFREAFDKAGFSNITVIHTPYLGGKR